MKMIRTYDFDPLMEEIEVILISKDTDIGVINEELISVYEVFNNLDEKHCKVRYRHCHYILNKHTKKVNAAFFSYYKV